MMSFCKKSVNSFLCLANPMNNTIDHNYNLERTTGSTKINIFRDGLGLISVTSNAQKTPNVLESSSVKSSSLPVKKDLGLIRFIDDIGGGVDGLMSCTESLGFESSDERSVDDEIGLCSTNSQSSTSNANKYRRNRHERRMVKKFPPPLSSLDQNGQPNFVLRPVRRDGRLELVEVRIHRPEILRASREDGRLKLHLITTNDESEESDEDEEEEEEQTENWRNIMAVNCSSEGFRRCHEEMEFHHHHHHNLQVWV